LICYGLPKQEENLARKFTAQVAHLSGQSQASDQDIEIEAHLLLNPTA